MSTALQTLTKNLATTFGMGDGADLSQTLKATAFKSGTQVSDAQMTALLVVATQYGLNPFTREIFAFPDKGGIVPVVGLDGWSRIINSHAQFDGMDFEQDSQSCTCIIYRKDRSHPVKVTEWLAECTRNTGPWTSHPRRMLRHKAMIQCARLAFGFTGIYEPDEAERIVEVNAPKRIDTETGEIHAVHFDAEAACALMQACTTPEAWNSVWKEQNALGVAAADKAGLARFKQVAKERRLALEQMLADNVVDAEVAA